jgi:hypothetical protein
MAILHERIKELKALNISLEKNTLDVNINGLGQRIKD